jgi:hypothetical protein
MAKNNNMMATKDFFTFLSLANELP